METRSTSNYAVLEAASCNFADMFSFRKAEEPSDQSEDKENGGSQKASRFSSMKKSSNLYFSKSSFFLPKPATPLSEKKSSDSTPLKSSPNSKKFSPMVAKRKSSITNPKSFPSDTVVTPEMLNLVCFTVDAKDSLSQKGLTKSLCHQCRVVSGDMKTICRSLTCKQGSFCGYCLKIWYGENAKRALMDNSWRCPSCRYECLCASCRAKQGFDPLPTAIASKALLLGFQSVNEYLQSIKQ